MIAVPLSILEIAVIQSNRPPAEILHGAVSLARRVEQLGYRRIWYAEHHKSPALADFPPSVVISHVAAATATIRVGSGAVLAPNHAPLSLTEQFGALAAIYPDRIDLGIGRGPGTLDEVTVRALRRGAPPASNEEYGEDVAAILEFAAERSDVPEPWLLCSSPAGARLAARLGLPMAFAYHLKPENTAESVQLYREEFRPSRWHEEPRVMLSILTICADSEARAAELARPFVILHSELMAGTSEHSMLSPEAASAHAFTNREQETLAALRAHQAQGTPDAVERRLAETVDRFGADELMLYTPIYNPKERARSFELLAAASTATA
jgi:luciferase family oxidoreductase group 1